MADRSRAHTILVRARESLADRLSELITDGESEFLDDASGNSYMDEIGSVYEKVGARLTQVNTMLANLPGAPAEAAPKTKPESSSTHGQDAQPTAPAPGDIALNFRVFGEAVVSGDHDTAAAALNTLFGIDLETASKCAMHFSTRVAADPAAMQRAMQLRIEIAGGRDNNSLKLLHECFRISGLIAIQVLQNLKSQFSGAA